MEGSDRDTGQLRAPAPRGGDSRISWQTLVIASLASVAAAFIVSSLWAPGTLIGAAVTPVIVALVSELLRKPIAAVPSPALPPLRTGARGAGAPPTAQQHPPSDRSAAAERADAAPWELDDGDELPAPAGAASSGEPTVVHQYARRDHRTWDRRRIRLALVTGALAFAIAVAFFVVADLTTGSAVTGRGGSSSLFSPRRSHDSKPASTTTTPATTPATTPQTTPPERTGTTPAPSGGAAPRQEPEATVPQTTPAPPPTTETPAPSDEAAPLEGQPEQPPATTP